MAFIANTDQYIKERKKRKGVHAKTKSSKNKNSKIYVKTYSAQGR